VSGLCPFAGRTEYVSAAQCGAYDAKTQIIRRPVAILSASHAEGRWFDPSRDHKVKPFDGVATQCLHNIGTKRA